MNSIHLCLVLGALVTTAASQETPKIRTASTTVAGIVGNSISLECLVENYEANTLMWARGPILERRLLTMGSILLVHDDRYSSTFDRNSSTYKLEIRNVDFSDAGVYQCLLPLAMDSVLTSDVEVQVLPKPGEVAFDWNATETSLSKSEEEPDGFYNDPCRDPGNCDSAINFGCNIDGFNHSALILSWSAAVFQYQRDTNLFNLFLVFGMPVAKVSSQNTPRIIRVSPTQIAEVGDNVTLECVLENVSTIGVVWIKKRDDIYHQYLDVATALVLRDSHITKTTTDNVTLCTLKLENLKLEDATTYQCVLMKTVEDLVTADVEVQVHSKSLI